MWTHLNAFCSIPHIDWTLCCWSAILVDTLGCIPLCTTHGLDILLLICNTCGNPWMHSALYFTWIEHSVVDPQYLCGHLWMYSALYFTWVGHSVVDLQFLCGHLWMYSALYFTWVGHSVVDLQYLCGHRWMYYALYFTWVGHSVVDLQYLWTSLDVFRSVLHMGWTFWTK